MSESTAEAYLHHVMSKLDVRSRAEVAAWAVAHHLSWHLMEAVVNVFWSILFANPSHLRNILGGSCWRLLGCCR